VGDRSKFPSLRGKRGGGRLLVGFCAHKNGDHRDGNREQGEGTKSGRLGGPSKADLDLRLSKKGASTASRARMRGRRVGV